MSTIRERYYKTTGFMISVRKHFYKIGKDFIIVGKKNYIRKKISYNKNSSSN